MEDNRKEERNERDGQFGGEMRRGKEGGEGGRGDDHHKLLVFSYSLCHILLSSPLDLPLRWLNPIKSKPLDY